MIAEAGRLGTVRQALVNPSDECLWNLLSACSNTGEHSYRPGAVRRYHVQLRRSANRSAASAPPAVQSIMHQLPCNFTCKVVHRLS